MRFCSDHTTRADDRDKPQELVSLITVSSGQLERTPRTTVRVRVVEYRAVAAEYVHGVHSDHPSSHTTDGFGIWKYTSEHVGLRDQVAAEHTQLQGSGDWRPDNVLSLVLGVSDNLDGEQRAGEVCSLRYRCAHTTSQKFETHVARHVGLEAPPCPNWGGCGGQVGPGCRRGEKRREEKSRKVMIKTKS